MCYKPFTRPIQNELGLDYHLNPLAGETNFGIKVKLWIKDISMYERERRGIMDKLFLNGSGSPLLTLFPLEVNVHEEYGINRSFC